jgi:hypothetical protein
MSRFFSSTERFLNLAPEEQMLVAIGVLVDGKESGEVFLSDPKKKYLADVANDLCEIPLQLRTPLLATALREARGKLSQREGR